MEIAGRKIGQGHPPYIISEISGNHCGSLSRAKELIHDAKKAGAHAVKTQCYEPETITLNISKPDFIVQDGLWQHRTLYELYKRAHTPFAWHKDLYKVAADYEITIFSSVFDFSAVDLLEHLGCPAYKIASFEIVDLPLIQYVAKTGKPIIISTGMASDDEILDAFMASGGKAAFLHCTSEYPGTIEAAGLGRMRRLNELTNHSVPIGVSDHTPNAVVPMLATALGAMIIEKHLKTKYGPKSEDDKFSLNPDQFADMVSVVNMAYEAGKATKPDPENPSRQMRRSLYAVADIAKGEQFTMANVRSIRPGFGLPPKKLDTLLGITASRRYRRGDPIKEKC